MIRLGSEWAGWGRLPRKQDGGVLTCGDVLAVADRLGVRMSPGDLVSSRVWWDKLAAVVCLPDSSSVLGCWPFPAWLWGCVVDVVEGRVIVDAEGWHHR